MANQKHLAILKQGVDVWNKWRQEHPDIQPNLMEADLEGVDLSGIDLSSTNLTGVNLTGANLTHAILTSAIMHSISLIDADLSFADLRDLRIVGPILHSVNLHQANLNGVSFSMATIANVDLSGARFAMIRTGDCRFFNVDFSSADLTKTELSSSEFKSVNFNSANLKETNLQGARFHDVSFREANLIQADLREAHLINVDFTGANLSMANLVSTTLEMTKLSNCLIYGISAWDVQLQDVTQNNLIITLPNQPLITVDNLKIAQFLHLLLNNKEIRDLIDTITAKVVLILGRFKPERKLILEALRDELRKYDYLSVLFDFEKPASRDFTETIRTLAHLSRFIIADLTEPSSIPQELQAIVPELEIPVQPVLLEVKKNMPCLWISRNMIGFSPFISTKIK